MYMSPLRPLSTTQAYVSGDVVIDENVAIAPGVLIQADPQSQVVVGAGTCIGMGAIIHAIGGRLEIGAGVNLGAGVLILGTSKIGENACIGSTSTIINSSIAIGQVIASGSLIGDRSRQITETTELTQSVQANPSFNPTTSVTDPTLIPEPHISTEAGVPATQVTEEATTSQFIEPANIVQGQQQLNKILGRIFPQGQNLNKLNNGDSSNDVVTST